MPRKKSGTENELWERMPGESVRHYEYFCAYRDMRYIPAANPDDLPKLDLSRDKRSIRRIAEQFGKSRQTIGDLSSRFNWQTRCNAYDLYILRRQRDKNEDRVLKMRENHAAVGEHLWKRGLRRLLSLPDDEISAADMVRMVDIGVKVERLSRMDTVDADRHRYENRSVNEPENNLLEALIGGTKERIEIHDIPEILEASESGDDVVEPSESVPLQRRNL